MRVARLEISWPVWLAAVAGHPLNKLASDIPADARVLNVENDNARQVSYLTIESASFADVPEWATMPTFTPTMTISVTEEAMLADLISRRHDFCKSCGEPLADDA